MIYIYNTEYHQCDQEVEDYMGVLCGKLRNAYRILVVNPKERGPRFGWENIKNWLSERGREAVVRIQVKQDWGKWLTGVNNAMNLPFP
jgi:hypothetical protein